jgi:hypothetical protein
VGGKGAYQVAAHTPPPYLNRNFANTDYVDTMISNALCDVSFSRYQSLKSTDDLYILILKNKTKYLRMSWTKLHKTKGGQTLWSKLCESVKDHLLIFVCIWKHLQTGLFYGYTSAMISTIFKIKHKLYLYSDSLRAGRSEDWIPVEVTFSASVHTSPWAHPASYTMCTGSPSRG